MLQPKMIEETAKLMHLGIAMGAKVYVLVNNRAGGNAPLIAQMIAEKLLHQD
jgi:Fe2+ transport system protein FeoA